jgi:hypothetical protein
MPGDKDDKGDLFDATIGEGGKAAKKVIEKAKEVFTAKKGPMLTSQTTKEQDGLTGKKTRVASGSTVADDLKTLGYTDEELKSKDGPCEGGRLTGMEKVRKKRAEALKKAHTDKGGDKDAAADKIKEIKDASDRLKAAAGSPKKNTIEDQKAQRKWLKGDKGDDDDTNDDDESDDTEDPNDNKNKKKKDDPKLESWLDAFFLILKLLFDMFKDLKDKADKAGDTRDVNQIEKEGQDNVEKCLHGKSKDLFNLIRKRAKEGKSVNFSKEMTGNLKEEYQNVRAAMKLQERIDKHVIDARAAAGLSKRELSLNDEQQKNLEASLSDEQLESWARVKAGKSTLTDDPIGTNDPIEAAEAQRIRSQRFEDDLDVIKSRAQEIRAAYKTKETDAANAALGKAYKAAGGDALGKEGVKLDAEKDKLNAQKAQAQAMKKAVESEVTAAREVRDVLEDQHEKAKQGQDKDGNPISGEEAKQEQVELASKLKTAEAKLNATEIKLTKAESKQREIAEADDKHDAKRAGFDLRNQALKNKLASPIKEKEKADGAAKTQNQSRIEKVKMKAATRRNEGNEAAVQKGRDREKEGDKRVKAAKQNKKMPKSKTDKSDTLAGAVGKLINKGTKKAFKAAEQSYREYQKAKADSKGEKSPTDAESKKSLFDRVKGFFGSTKEAAEVLEALDEADEKPLSLEEAKTELSKLNKDLDQEISDKTSAFEKKVSEITDPKELKAELKARRENLDKLKAKIAQRDDNLESVLARLENPENEDELRDHAQTYSNTYIANHGEAVLYVHETENAIKAGKQQALSAADKAYAEANGEALGKVYNNADRELSALSEKQSRVLPEGSDLEVQTRKIEARDKSVEKVRTDLETARTAVEHVEACKARRDEAREAILLDMPETMREAQKVAWDISDADNNPDKTAQAVSDELKQNEKKLEEVTDKQHTQKMDLYDKKIKAAEETQAKLDEQTKNQAKAKSVEQQEEIPGQPRQGGEDPAKYSHVGGHEVAAQAAAVVQVEEQKKETEAALEKNIQAVAKQQEAQKAELVEEEKKREEKADKTVGDANKTQQSGQKIQALEQQKQKLEEAKHELESAKKDLEVKRKKLEAAKENLKKAKEKTQNAKEKYQEAQKKHANAKKDYFSSAKKVEASEAAFKKASKNSHEAHLKEKEVEKKRHDIIAKDDIKKADHDRKQADLKQKQKASEKAIKQSDQKVKELRVEKEKKQEKEIKAKQQELAEKQKGIELEKKQFEVSQQKAKPDENQAVSQSEDVAAREQEKAKLEADIEESRRKIEEWAKEQEQAKQETQQAEVELEAEEKVNAELVDANEKEKAEEAKNEEVRAQEEADRNAELEKNVKEQKEASAETERLKNEENQLGETLNTERSDRDLKETEMQTAEAEENDAAAESTSAEEEEADYQGDVDKFGKEVGDAEKTYDQKDTQAQESNASYSEQSLDSQSDTGESEDQAAKDDSSESEQGSTVEEFASVVPEMDGASTGGNREESAEEDDATSQQDKEDPAKMDTAAGAGVAAVKAAVPMGGNAEGGESDDPNASESENDGTGLDMVGGDEEGKGDEERSDSEKSEEDDDDAVQKFGKGSIELGSGMLKATSTESHAADDSFEKTTKPGETTEQSNRNASKDTGGASDKQAATEQERARQQRDERPVNPSSQVNFCDKKKSQESDDEEKEAKRDGTRLGMAVATDGASEADGSGKVAGDKVAEEDDNNTSTYTRN